MLVMRQLCSSISIHMRLTNCIHVSLFLCICLSLSPYLNTFMNLSSYLILTSEFLLKWETIKMVLFRRGNNINFFFLIASVAEFQMGIFPTQQHGLNCRKRFLLLYIVYDIDIDSFNCFFLLLYIVYDIDIDSFNCFTLINY